MKNLFRFTIRELLIATVAVAALVALFVQRRPFDDHTMLQSFEPHQMLTKVCNDLGIPYAMASSGHSSGVVFDGGYRIEAEIDLSKPTYDDVRTKLMPELMKRFKRAIEEDGATIVGEGKNGSPKFDEISHFSFEYRRGPVRGITRAYTFENPDGTPKVFILMDEF
ncbi:hypothetical protein [Aeoliella sp. SH292]|uniref:hypothetical protein n=1 Tax=Aeoliella sp. SH292 TaxID=3454464 RepID=UPI003F95CBCE